MCSFRRFLSRPVKDGWIHAVVDTSALGIISSSKVRGDFITKIFLLWPGGFGRIERSRFYWDFFAGEKFLIVLDIGSMFLGLD